MCTLNRDEALSSKLVILVIQDGVEEGLNIKCHACGWPLLPAEAEEASYEHGVSCKYCIDNTTEKQKEGFRMRQSQIAAAKRKRL